MSRDIRGILSKIGENPYIFDFLQKVCNLGDFKCQISSRLGATHEDSILDVGCGTGLYSTLAKGRYVGIDLNESYIRYAQTRYKDNNKRFIVGDVTKLNLDGEPFDKTLYLAVLHHFNEEDNLKILRKISSVTRKMVLILDLTLPDKPTPIQGFFLGVERGRFVRPLTEQIRIIEKVLDVGDASLFLNRTRFGLFSIIKSYPR